MAKALKLDDKIGSFDQGRDADFIVVDCMATPSQQMRKDYLERKGKWNLENKLFGIQTLGMTVILLPLMWRGILFTSQIRAIIRKQVCKNDCNNNPKAFGCSRTQFEETIFQSSMFTCGGSRRNKYEV